ncbi:uncharacterized protein A1O9_01742 [Exophiala aquamarina CBS 119918]|uniref:Choline transport protein n=1 Tax=Exophiala aquamarina CBS 119918 TaxID=1182545 RepID=A0A072PUN9_9EURO|nr:uncharacterized protein A1O9_01742 [Exophiala aquamarina CBS 119918]KEF63764.1 hypothetical protein A1O9_01742 [Exophiala aquamarina CBS 119918]
MGSSPTTTEPEAIGASNSENLSADELELRAQGHIGELPRQFGVLSTLSLAFTITNSWIAYSAVFVIPLIAGGATCVVWSLVIGFVVCSIITLGLAELASAYPTSGGQYHFSFMVAPPRFRAAVSYTIGWVSVFSWWMLACGSCIFCAQAVAVMAAVYHPDFAATQWQIYLIYVALTILSTALITLFPKQLPQAEIACFWLSIVGFIVSTITVLARSEHKQTGQTVFADWNNNSGWVDGVAFFIGIGQGMFAFIALDAATHVSEEMPNPRKNVPRAMGLTMVIGMITGFVWTVAFLFSATDLDEVMNSPSPYVTVYFQAIHNDPVALFFTVWLFLAYVSATISCYATSGRLVWAFSRDNGLPFSKFFSKVHPTLKVPVNATVLTCVFAIFYGLIYIGSTTAFNSFLSISILGLNATYTVPQAILAVCGRDKILPPRPFALGRWTGLFCNIFSSLWIAMYTVWFCFPTFLPVEAQNMNYLSVIAVGELFFIGLSWFLGKRKTFTGPKVVFEGLHLSASHSTQAVEAGEASRGDLKGR